MWWDGKTWRNASEVNSDSEDQLQKDVREILIGQYLGSNIDEYLGSIGEEYEPDVLDNYDPVEKPAHYNQGGIEAIDYIKQQLGNEGYKAYCLGNVMKYLHRHTYKGKPKEDLAKAVWYLNEAKGTY